MKIKETVIEKKRIMYVAEDGEEFYDEQSCKRYEEKLSRNKFIEEAEKFRIAELDEQLPLSDDGMMNEDNTYRWYKIKNEAEFDIVNEAYRKSLSAPKNYPEIICVETVGHEPYMDDAYSYNMETCREITKAFWEKLDIIVTFENMQEE